MIPLDQISMDDLLIDNVLSEYNKIYIWKLVDQLSKQLGKVECLMGRVVGFVYPLVRNDVSSHS